MRNLLFLLAGLGLACVIGFGLFAVPTVPVENPAAVAPGTRPPLLLLALLVLGSWASLLIAGSFWLRAALALLIVAAGVLAVLAGALTAYWDHHMRSHETVGWWSIGAGVLMLLSQLLGWWSSGRDSQDE